MFLFLNDVAGSEILLIVIFILIFFGPKSVPSIARTVGRTLRQIQNASADIQNEIKKTAGEYTDELNIKSVLKETAQEIQQPLDQMVNELDDSIHYRPSEASRVSNHSIQSPLSEPLTDKLTDKDGFIEPHEESKS